MSVLTPVSVVPPATTSLVSESTPAVDIHASMMLTVGPHASSDHVCPSSLCSTSDLYWTFHARACKMLPLQWAHLLQSDKLFRGKGMLQYLSGIIPPITNILGLRNLITSALIWILLSPPHHASQDQPSDFSRWADDSGDDFRTEHRSSKPQLELLHLHQLCLHHLCARTPLFIVREFEDGQLFHQNGKFSLRMASPSL